MAEAFEGMRKVLLSWMPLLVGSLLSVGWALLLPTMIPVGLCDWVFVYLPEELRRPHTFEESRRITGQFCVYFGSAFERYTIHSVPLPPR